MIRTGLMALPLLVLFSTAHAQTIQSSINLYSEHVHTTYAEALRRAEILRTDIQLFTGTPSVLTQEMAKESWKNAREIYGQTEAFRFYNGPIDQDGGPEGALNSWPLDESYIDYVVGAPTAGIINNPTKFPVINRELLVSLNELDGEKNISTGYHAIEFLLWGQDFFNDGPGQRSFMDFVNAPQAERRVDYLNLISDILIEDLTKLETQWRPGENNYRAEFEGLKDTVAMKKILSGVIFMAGDELSGERMYVAYDTQGQEDEHSCFSDMTHMDIQWNYWGIEAVIKNSKILDLPEVKNTPAAQAVRERMIQVRSRLALIPVPFDQAIKNEKGRESILTSVEDLEGLAKDMVEISKLLNAKVDY